MLSRDSAGHPGVASAWCPEWSETFNIALVEEVSKLKMNGRWTNVRTVTCLVSFYSGLFALGCGVDGEATGEAQPSI
jgi:hypothetical protein